MKILTIVGARPQFVKAAVISRVILQQSKLGKDISEDIIHTGQHFDHKMSAAFFDELNIPEPVANLNINSGPHGQMTGRMLEQLEREMLARKPDLIMVYGDTNSTLSGALSASKLHIPVAHVEAGLRSFNRRMPEEINRVMTDHLSNFLFCPTLESVANLQREGIENQVFNVGDVMLDSFQFVASSITEAERQATLEKYQIKKGPFALVTCHRAENTDSKARLKAIFSALRDLNKHIKVILPIHPRTKKCVNEYGITELLHEIHTPPPASYREMLTLLENASLVITDSGGLQKEAFFAQTPCLTLREETEWNETLVNKNNQLIEPQKQALTQIAIESLDNGFRGEDTPYGDGAAGEKIVEALLNI